MTFFDTPKQPLRLFSEEKFFQKKRQNAGRISVKVFLKYKTPLTSFVDSL